MAGKAPIFPSRRLGYALDYLSKNALIDLVVDRAKLELESADDGPSEATDAQLAAVIQGWLRPVLHHRGDKPVSLVGLMAKLDKASEDYRNKTGKFAEVKRLPDGSIPTAGQVAFGADYHERMAAEKDKEAEGN